MIAWVVLDARWVWNLARQVRETAAQYAGKDWKERDLGRQSMILMAEKVMPLVNAGMSGSSKAAG